MNNFSNSSPGSGGGPRRGKRLPHRECDVQMNDDVEELIDNGLTVCDACKSYGGKSPNCAGKSKKNENKLHEAETADVIFHDVTNAFLTALKDVMPNVAGDAGNAVMEINPDEIMVPWRYEDLEDFSNTIADRLLKDPDVRENLATAVSIVLRRLMEPA